MVSHVCLALCLTVFTSKENKYQYKKIGYRYQFHENYFVKKFKAFIKGRA